MRKPQTTLFALLVSSISVAAIPAFATEVTIARALDSNHYDPQRTTALAATEVLFMLGDTLVSLKDDLDTLVPSLAKSWDMSEDGLTYTFKLRDDVSFCDGKKFTADDVVYTINRLIDPKTNSPAAWRAGAVESVKALDATTVEYKLKEPYSELLYQLTQSYAVILDSKNVEALGKNFGVTGFNGTGPFCWGEWKPRAKMVLNRHDAYKWGPTAHQNAGPAYVEKVTWQIVPEPNMRTNALLTGQADLSLTLPFIAFQQMRESPGFSIQKAGKAAWTEYVGFKIDKPTVSDLAVRKAINMAFSQQAMAEDLFYGEPIPAVTFMSPDTRHWPQAANEILAGYDVDLANKMLDDAGWARGSDGIRVKDGVRLAPLFYVFSGPSAEYLQAELLKIGVELKIQQFDPTIIWSKLATQEYDMFQMGFAYNAAIDGLNLYMPSNLVPAPNRMNWKDPETDQLLAEARSAVDPKVAEAAVNKVSMKVTEAAIWLPIYHTPTTIAQSDRFKVMIPHPIQGAGLYKGLDIEPAK